eukprot:TCONS_00039506-protein
MIAKIAQIDPNDTDVIRVACRRYFNHQKRDKRKKDTMTPEQLQSDIKLNRSSSRRTKTYQRRRKIGFQMDLEGEELELFNLIKGGELMTDEESEYEDGVETGRLIVRKLAWRSQKLDDLIIKIDTENPLKAVKGRIVGELSQHEPPIGVDERLIDIMPVDEI